MPERAPEPAEADDWPQCPGCGKRRSTQCPVCGTFGTEFPPVDMGFVLMSGLGGGDAAGACDGCGSCGCAGETEEAADQADTTQECDDAVPPRMLICPTCDEPFEPEYPRLCQWCGHEFPDGFEVDGTVTSPEQLNSRIIAAVLILGVLGVILSAWFLYLV